MSDDLVKRLRSYDLADDTLGKAADRLDQLTALNAEAQDDAAVQLQRAQELTGRLNDAEAQLNDVLAVLNRDGGHHQAEVGREQAIEDGLEEFHRSGLALEAAEAEVARLKRALELYGQHKETCAASMYATGVGGHCTCGFRQALAGQKEKSDG